MKSMVKRKRPERILAWYQTTVFRASCLAILIVLGGYLGSALSLRQALKGLATLAYDEELTATMEAYLQTLKQLDDELRTQVLQNLRLNAPPQGWSQLNETELRQRLDEAGIGALMPAKDLPIKKATELPTGSGAIDLAWTSRTELRLGSYLVPIELSATRKRFDEVSKLKQRYELIGGTWDQEIAPSLFLTHLFILIGTTLLIGTVLLVLVRRYISDAQKVLSGFRRWSEIDSQFRLPLALSGEMGVIAAQFNEMADEVAANRRRSLSLEKIASWQTMARKLAHEIKNPLTPIQMMVSQLKRSYRGEDPNFERLLADATTIITEEVQTLRRMVDHFSQFARLPDPQFSPADLIPVCQQVIEMQQTAFPQHVLSFNSPLASAPLSMDSQLIRQMLSNLVKNAAEASQDRSAQIALSLSLEAGIYRLDVSDDGPGILEADINRIFEAYFTSKHTGPQPGMGLGLAICQKIALEHKGDLTVISRPGATVFTILLPITPV